MPTLQVSDFNSSCNVSGNGAALMHFFPGKYFVAAQAAWLECVGCPTICWAVATTTNRSHQSQTF